MKAYQFVMKKYWKEERTL